MCFVFKKLKKLDELSRIRLLELNSKTIARRESETVRHTKNGPSGRDFGGAFRAGDPENYGS